MPASHNPLSKPGLTSVPQAPGPDLSPPRQAIVRHAMKNLGKSYHWGGSSPETGFDCSGLVSFSYLQAGIHLPRTTTEQLRMGRVIKRTGLTPADLVFFDNPMDGKTLHVGIYIGDNLFVHAPGKGRQVTYADLNNPYFKKHYIGSRRYID